ncbi:MAG: hypothetical protein Kow0079_09450 [Vicingaceae bacterium]
MNQLYKIPLFFLAILLLFACKKDSNNIQPYTGKNYVPLKTGTYIIYQVDSYYIDDFYNPSKIDTFSFKIKEEITEKFIDAEGNTAFKLTRYKKNTDTTNWFVKDVWYVNKTETAYETVEENKRYIKLIFPVKLDKTWDGNLKNIDPSREFTYTQVHESDVVGTLSFDSVLTVNQIDETTLISQKLIDEKYAAGIGMIYKYYKDVATELNGTLKSGVIYEMKVINYAK